MSRSAAYAAELDARGVWRPKGDGDALRTTATTWTDLADVLEEVGGVLDNVAASIIDNYRGAAAERFHDAWQRYTGPNGYVLTMVADCRRLAASLNDFGGDVDRADAQLLHLVTEALELQQAAIAANVDPAAYDDWLRQSADVLAGALSGNADSRLAALAAIQGLPDIDLPATAQALDADAVTWVDPGDPLDLSGIAHTAVDFGAGEGEINPNLDLDPNNDVDTAAGGSGAGGGDAGGAGGGGGGAGGGGAGYGGSGFDAGDFDMGGESTPVSVPLPDESVLAGAGAAGAGAGVAAAAAAAGKRSGMFPMMPMGAASAGGDEGNEPKRRSLRKRPQLA